jgi:hypothetical protein
VQENQHHWWRKILCGSNTVNRRSGRSKQFRTRPKCHSRKIILEKNNYVPASARSNDFQLAEMARTRGGEGFA